MLSGKKKSLKMLHALWFPFLKILEKPGSRNKKHYLGLPGIRDGKMGAERCEGTFWSYEHVLEHDCSDGNTILHIFQNLLIVHFKGVYL